MSPGTFGRLFAVLVLGLLCTGCFSYSPAREGCSRAVEGVGSPLPWPEWDAAALEPLRSATPKELYRARLQLGKKLEDLKNEDQRNLVTSPEYTVVRNEVVEGELIRMYRRAPEIWQGLDLYFKGFVPSGAALSPLDVQRNTWKLARWHAERNCAEMQEVWGTLGLDADPTRGQVAIDAGIPFHIPEELPKDCRGIVLHLWALGGNDYEHAVVRETASRGWLVVDIKPLNTAVPDLTPEALARVMVLEQESSALSGQVPPTTSGEPWSKYQRRLAESPAHQRRVEIQTEIGNLRNPRIPLCEKADVAPAAAQLAERIDTSFAQNAAAVRAILETARRMHPKLRGMPVVVMGFSAGALSTPTVAARLLPDVDAVVIIGGAANALGVAMRSVISRGGIRLSCAGKAPKEELVKELEREYLEHGHLDAYHTAPLLAECPVLVVDAGMDTWVPSDLGEILFQRLGKPDRLHMAMGGHQFLFYFLPRRAGWIADWVVSAVGGGRAQASGKNPGVEDKKH